MQAAQSDEPHITGTLVVDSAIHGGLCASLAPGVMSVGRAISSDLVLGDPSLGGTHFRLHVGSTLGLEAVEQPLVLTNSEVIAPGQTRIVVQAIEFSAGDVPMRLDVVRPPVSKSHSVWPRVAAATVLLAFAGSAAYAFAGRASLESVATAPTPGTPRLQAAALPDLAALQAQLDERHLGSVRFEALSDGSYRASGTVTPQEAAAWHDAKRWLDEASAGGIVLVDTVSVTAAMPSLAIQSAWIGARPYVIDGHGQKLFVGAVVANGWTIEGIEAGRVSMRRQGQRLAVTF